MSFDDLKPIYGFPNGKTVACYKNDGKDIIIGGADSSGIKVYDTHPETQDYVSAQVCRHTEDVTCIAVSPKSGYATGGSDGLVMLYSDANAFDKILVRSTVPVRAMCYHPDGSKLAIVSDDESIRIVLIADNSKIVSLKGHKVAVKSVSYDKKGEYLVSSDTQGDVFIWSVESKEPVPRIVKKLPGFAYRASLDSVLETKVSWNPDNTCFAFPGTNQDIRVFSRDIWTPFYNLEGEHSQDVITFAWSPNGYYLASASSDKVLVVWDTKTKTKVRSEITADDVTGLAWNPSENQLVITDYHGEIKFWDGVIPTGNSNYPHPAIMRQVVKKEPTKKPAAATAARFTDIDATEDMEEEGEDLDMGDDVNMLFDDDDLEEELGDFVIDDDGAGYVETPEQIVNRVKQQKTLTLEANTSTMVKSQRKIELVFDPPTTFQPGETPYHKPEANKSFEPAQGERRYMAYNLIGAITTIYEEGHSIINVEFHDQSEYRNFHFTDVLNFSMAAISSAGTVYAVEGKEAIKKSKRLNADGEETEDEDEDEDEDNEANIETPLNSTLYFRPNNWGSEKDWTHHMLPGEDVVSVAINRVSVIATTSLGYVRIFSISGIQRHVFSLENIVSVTAMTDLALLVYSTGPAFNNQQNLKYILFNTESNEILQKDNIQLTTDSEINWIGFTETNQAAVYDSANVLRVLHRQRRPDQGSWIPIFDGKSYAKSQNKTERYWPVGVLRDRFMCVILRGNNPYPFFPRPPIKDIPLQLPLLEMNTEIGQFEEQILRVHTCTLHERDEAEATNTEEEYQEIFNDADIEMDIALLKLINLACKSEKVSRALDLTLTLATSESIDKAIKIASFHRYTSLAEKMTNIKEAKFMGNQLITKPLTLADSLTVLPSIYTSTQSTLNGDLAFVNSSNNNNGTVPQSKRNQDSFMFEEGQSSFMMDSSDDAPPVKKAKPFQFSSI